MLQHDLSCDWPKLTRKGTSYVSWPYVQDPLIAPQPTVSNSPLTTPSWAIGCDPVVLSFHTVAVNDPYLCVGRPLGPLATLPHDRHTLWPRILEPGPGIKPDSLFSLPHEQYPGLLTSLLI